MLKIKYIYSLLEDAENQRIILKLGKLRERIIISYMNHTSE